MSDFRVSMDGSFIEYEGRFWTPQEWLDRKPLADQLLKEWLDLDLSDSKARYSLMVKTANYLQGRGPIPPISEQNPPPRRSPMSENSNSMIERVARALAAKSESSFPPDQMVRNFDNEAVPFWYLHVDLARAAIEAMLHEGWGDGLNARLSLDLGSNAALSEDETAPVAHNADRR